MTTKLFDVLHSHEVEAIHNTNIRNVLLLDLTIEELQQLFLALRIPNKSIYNAISTLYFLLNRVELVKTLDNK